MSKRFGRSAAAAVLFAILLIATPGAARAQTASVLAGAGITSYDLSGTGTQDVEVVRARFGLLFVRVEPSLTYFRYRGQSGPRTALFLPEAQIQFAMGIGPVVPYFGLGAGFAHASTLSGGAYSDGNSDNDATLSAALGTDVNLVGGWFVNVDGRLRAIDPWTGSMADLTLAVGKRF